MSRIRNLKCSQVLTLVINIFFADMSFTIIDENGTQSQLDSSIQD